MIERSRPCSSRCALRALIASPLRFAVRASDAFSRVAPDVYEEYVREEVGRLVENDTLRCLLNGRVPSLARV